MWNVKDSECKIICSDHRIWSWARPGSSKIEATIFFEMKLHLNVNIILKNEMQNWKVRQIQITKWQITTDVKIAHCWFNERRNYHKWSRENWRREQLSLVNKWKFNQKRLNKSAKVKCAHNWAEYSEQYAWMKYELSWQY